MTLHVNAQTHNRGTVMIQEVLITPLIAAKWLSKNPSNRPLRPVLVKQYADDISAGKWQQNGETIKKSEDDELLDGQHRLHAIVRAQVPVKMLVVTGLSRNSFQTIDTGMRRTVAQLLTISGKPNAAVLGAIGRWLILLENKSDQQRPVSSQAIFDAIQRHPLSAHFASRHTDARIKALLVSASQAVMVLAAEKYGQEIPDSFLDAFMSGEGLRKGDPVFELRERLIQNASRVAKLNTNTVVAITIKAVRAYATQRTIGVLRWSPNEEWPSI
jgi:hypothetical protein